MVDPEMKIPEVPVLIAGGGPIGLLTSILLSRYGVRSLLVEKHPGTSIHPKARGINVRTMEIFRHCGIEDGVRAAGLPPEFKENLLIWAESLAGKELERRTQSGSADTPLSPASKCYCAQDILEPVLRARAQASDLAQVRFATKLVAFEQVREGVLATLSRDGRQSRVRARYMVAADGAAGGTREALGVALKGTVGVYQNINVHFRADLSRWTKDRPAVHYHIEQPGLKGVFLTIDGRERWLFTIHLPKGASADQYTAPRCADIVREAVGVRTLDIEVLAALPWTASALVAERFRQGSVFLAGDAAHQMPPTGGLGMNTGAQEAHNLAWKLAAVLQGWAGPALLDTYDEERRPWGAAIVEHSRLNAQSRGLGGSEGPKVSTARPEFLHEIGLILGQTYASSVVVADGTPLPEVSNAAMEYVPVARPGSRAPHVWLERGGARLSTLDLFGGGLTLLAGASGNAWRDAARAIASKMKAPLEAFVIGPEGDLRDAGGWRAAYGVEPAGAVLVRPDGYVAWRSKSDSADAPRELERAVACVLGRTPAAAGARQA